MFGNLQPDFKAYDSYGPLPLDEVRIDDSVPALSPPDLASPSLRSSERPKQEGIGSATKPA
jgi:hypothetical protein